MANVALNAEYLSHVEAMLMEHCIEHGRESESSDFSDSFETSAVLPFSKLITTFFGYFDPENVFLDNENK